MSRLYHALFAALFALPVMAVAGSPADAQSLRWPSSTNQREAKPTWIGKPRWADQSGPAQEAPKANEQPTAPVTTASNPAIPNCKPGETCVKCVANCGDKAPTTVQKLDTEQVAAARPATGSTEPAVGHGRWNAIRCYDQGGCSATGVAAPRRIERSSDGYVTYWRIW